MKRKILSIGVLSILLLSLVALPALADGVSLKGGVYDSVLTLDNKTDFTSDGWDLTSSDAFGGTLGYNASGSTFVWGLEATVPTDGNYALIYYADFTGDRYGTWGGDNPGAVIATVTAASGVISASGSKNLAMDLPCPPDANQFEHDYSVAPDNYTNAHGAKIWLVPTSALTSGTSLPVVAWPPDNNWLFETDLIWYDDTDVVSNIVGITVGPTALNFGILTPGQLGDAGDVIVTNSGNVPIDVTATAGPPASVFNYLKLEGDWAGNYTKNLPLPTNFDDVGVTLPVPGGWIPTGPETGTLTFIATVTP